MEPLLLENARLVLPDADAWSPLPAGAVRSPQDPGPGLRSCEVEVA